MCHNTAHTNRYSTEKNAVCHIPAHTERYSGEKNAVCHIPAHTERYSSEKKMLSAIFQPIQKHTAVKRIVCATITTRQALTIRRDSDLYTDQILRRQLRRKCSLPTLSHRETQDDAGMVVGGGGRAWGV